MSKDTVHVKPNTSGSQGTLAIVPKKAPTLSGEPMDQLNETPEPKPGQKFLHVHGHVVEVLLVITWEATLQKAVVYKHLDNDQVWGRLLEVFQQRFKPLDMGL
jgi:hypothetical protein